MSAAKIINNLITLKKEFLLHGTKHCNEICMESIGKNLTIVTDVITIIAMFRSTSCLCSVPLAIATASKLSGASVLPKISIFPMISDMYDVESQRSKIGISILMLSQRHATKNSEKNMISVDCVFSNEMTKYIAVKET